MRNAAFAIALDEKTLSPTARLRYDHVARISLSANDSEYDHPEASQNPRRIGSFVWIAKDDRICAGPHTPVTSSMPRAK